MASMTLIRLCIVYTSDKLFVVHLRIFSQMVRQALGGGVDSGEAKEREALEWRMILILILPAFFFFRAAGFER